MRTSQAENEISLSYEFNISDCDCHKVGGGGGGIRKGKPGEKYVRRLLLLSRAHFAVKKRTILVALHSLVNIRWL